MSTIESVPGVPQKALVDLLNAKTQAEFDTGKADLLRRVDAALAIADTKEVTDDLQELKAALQNLNFLPEAKHDAVTDTQQLQKMLEENSSFSLGDLTELFLLLQEAEQDRKKQDQAARLAVKPAVFALITAEKKMSYDAAESEKAAGVASGGGQIAGGLVQIGVGGSTLIDTIKATKHTSDVGTMSKKVQEKKEHIRDKEDTVGGHNDKIATLKDEYDGASAAEKSALRRQLAEERAARREARIKTKEMQAELGPIEGRMKDKSQSSETLLRYADAKGRLGQAMTSASTGSGTMVAAFDSAGAKKEDANAKELSSFRELANAEDQTNHEFISSANETFGQAGNLIRSINESTNQSALNIAHNTA
jgi:hypothetical protein